MKCFAILSLILNSHAFQPGLVNLHPLCTALNFYPKNFDRAQDCATHYGVCNLEELERLANELEEFQHSEVEGGLQGRDHYMDTKQVADMLRAQSNLKHMVEEYVVVHHQPETFDMHDV